MQHQCLSVSALIVMDSPFRYTFEKWPNTAVQHTTYIWDRDNEEEKRGTKHCIKNDME